MDLDKVRTREKANSHAVLVENIQWRASLAPVPLDGIPVAMETARWLRTIKCRIQPCRFGGFIDSLFGIKPYLDLGYKIFRGRDDF